MSIVPLGFPFASFLIISRWMSTIERIVPNSLFIYEIVENACLALYLGPIPF